MKRHISTVHEKRKPFSCQDCLHAFGSKQELQRHGKTCSGPRPGIKPKKANFYVCQFCNAGFNQQKMLNDHLHQIHQVDMQNNLQNYKSQNFNNVVNNLLGSLQSPTPINLNDTSLNQGNSIVNQLQQAIPNANIQAMSMSPSLKNNLNVNGNDHNTKGPVPNMKKIYKCGLCEMNFSSKKTIDQHFWDAHQVGQTTTGKTFVNENEFLKTELPFKCSMCDSGFSYEVGLKNHMSTVHDIRKSPNAQKNVMSNYNHGNMQISVNSIQEGNEQSASDSSIGNLVLLG